MRQPGLGRSIVSDSETPLDRLVQRRRFVKQALAGSTIAVLGGVYYFSDARTHQALAQTRSDGRPRLPPGQRVIARLKPMGGEPGDGRRSAFRLRLSGELARPVTLTFADLMKLPQHSIEADVHCVTGWSVLGARWKGVSLVDIAERFGVKPQARHVIFGAAHGYTANVPRRDALKQNVLLVYEYDGRPLAQAHGAPLRALVPDLYFWKSAKWLTEIHFSRQDAPGYWELRGYHNHGDPWLEERYA